MSPKFSILLLSVSSLSTFTASALDDIPYGVEALAQYRSEYRFRGFTLAQDTTDLQIGTRYAFDKTSHLEVSTWHSSATGDGDFTETGFLADYRKDVGQLTYSLSATYRSYSNSFFDSGVSFEAAAIYPINDSLDLSGRLAYDTGAEGIYGDIDLSYYHRINDDSYITLRSGISAVDSYYLRDGFNDFFAKATYTYNINQSISVSPYIGTSILLDNKHSDNDSLHGGVYFAVSF